MPQQSNSTALGEALCGVVEMQLRAPQTFISVDVADSGDELLIEDGALNRSSSSSYPLGHYDGIKPRIERVKSDVWDRTLTASWHELKSTEHALVDETQLGIIIKIE